MIINERRKGVCKTVGVGCKTVGVGYKTVGVGVRQWGWGISLGSYQPQ